MPNRFLIVIAGPTAVGKTSFSLSLAERYDTHIVSADSRQLYSEFKIGTSPPSPDILERIPHHFIQTHSVFQPISAGDYEREAVQLLNKLYEDLDVVLLVGGSGLYIKALCEGLDSFPEVSDEVSRRVERRYESEGIEYLRSYLSTHDPDYHEEVDLDNPHRLLRAVKVMESSGKPFSHFRQDQPASRGFTPVYIALNRPRPILYERINRRVDDMMDAGLLEEARKLYPHRALRSLQTVGYRELFRYLDGECPLEKAIERIKRNTRRYAKRQLTWFRNDGNYTFFHPDEESTILSYIEDQIKLR